MRRQLSILLLAIMIVSLGTRVFPREFLSYSEKLKEMEEAASFRNDEGARILIEYLRDRDLRVRARAITKLVEIEKIAVPALVSFLGDEEVRWLVSGALINIGTPALESLILALKSDIPAVRRNALFVLRQLNAVEAAPSIQLSLDDPDISVQVQAIYTISKLGGEGALRLIIDKMKDDRIEIRNAAIEGMSYFGREAIPYLVKTIQGEAPQAKVSAIKSLGLVGAKEGIIYVLKALRDRDSTVRNQACVTLGEFGDESVVADLVGMFNDPSPSVREAANESVSNFTAGSKHILKRLIEKGTTLEKINAAIVVRKVKLMEFSPSMTDLLRDRTPEVRISAVTALMELEDPDTVEPLVNALLDNDVRWFSVIALRKFGHKNLKPLLRKTESLDLNYWKQYVLEDIGEKAIDGFVEILKGEDLSLKIGSICTLKQIKDARAIYPLINLLGDDKLGFLVSSVLAQMGGMAIEPLIISLNDEDPAIRSRAASALGEVGLKRVVNPLKELLNDENPEVSEAARKAIEKIYRDTTKGTGEEIQFKSRDLPLR